VSYEGGDGP